MSEEHVVSGEQYRAAQQSVKNRTKNIGVGKLVVVAGVIVLCGLSFLGGTAYQKHHGTKTTATAAQGAGGFAGRGGLGGGQRANGSMGSVTAVSATSITVNDQRSNSSKTYAIDNSTSISDNGATVAASDIKVGDTVFVSVSSAASTTATRILVNPSFGSGQQDSGSTNAQTN